MWRNITCKRCQASIARIHMIFQYSEGYIWGAGTRRWCERGPRGSNLGLAMGLAIICHNLLTNDSLYQVTSLLLENNATRNSARTSSSTTTTTIHSTVECLSTALSYDIQARALENLIFHSQYSTNSKYINTITSRTFFSPLLLFIIT